MLQTSFLAVAGALLLASASSGREAATEAPLPPAAVDHHLHIQSEAVTCEFRALARKSPEVFKMLNPAILDTRTGSDAIRVLDQAGIKRGVLLSEAYVFSSAFVDPNTGDVAKLTRAENAYTVAAARASHGRLVAFVGINPLWAGASDELTYWAGRPGVTGVKIQLGNAGFDPRSRDQVARLAAFFDRLGKLKLPAVVHVRSATDYGVADVRTFVEQVLPKHGDLPIQIAHAGGYGSLDQATIDALEVYATAIKQDAPGTRHLVFDLAAVVINDKTDPALAARFVALMRAIGLDRFVIGSDWPSLSSPKEHNALLEAGLPLRRDEWTTVLANKAPYLR